MDKFDPGHVVTRAHYDELAAQAELESKIQHLAELLAQKNSPAGTGLSGETGGFDKTNEGTFMQMIHESDAGTRAKRKHWSELDRMLCAIRFNGECA